MKIVILDLESSGPLHAYAFKRKQAIMEHVLRDSKKAVWRSCWLICYGRYRLRVRISMIPRGSCGGRIEYDFYFSGGASWVCQRSCGFKIISQNFVFFCNSGILKETKMGLRLYSGISDSWRSDAGRTIWWCSIWPFNARRWAKHRFLTMLIWRLTDPADLKRAPSWYGRVDLDSHGD